MKGLKGRYYCFTIVVRLNQIEVSPGVFLGVDERAENTPENLAEYRQAICDAVPDARITIAFSHSALTDESANYQKLREMAKDYHDRYGDDVTYVVGAYFGGAYSPRAKINAAIDEALGLLRSFMGDKYLPGSIVGGFLPSAVIEHIASLGIHTVQGNIFSQYSVDNQDGEGSICYPYYPSKEHFCKPAQGKEDFIDCVNFDGWTVDFLSAMYCGGGHNCRMGAGPIETLRPFGHDKGIEIMLSAADQMLKENCERNGGFGMVTSIWELCLIQKDGYHAMNIDGSVITRFLRALKERYPDVKIVTFGELGSYFREHVPNNSTLDYRFVHRGIGVDDSDDRKEIRWYMNEKFRLAILKNLDNGEEKVVDFTDYTKKYIEPGDSDYSRGIVQRNWSLMGDINQKQTRPQDKPIEYELLSARQKQIIKDFEEKTGKPIRTKFE